MEQSPRKSSTFAPEWSKIQHDRHREQAQKCIEILRHQYSDPFVKSRVCDLLVHENYYKVIPKHWISCIQNNLTWDLIDQLASQIPDRNYHDFDKSNNHVIHKDTTNHYLTSHDLNWWMSWNAPTDMMEYFWAIESAALSRDRPSINQFPWSKEEDSPHAITSPSTSTRNDINETTFFTGMKPKKRHEVQSLGALMQLLAQELHTENAVDFGSGAGYLAQYLNIVNKFNVTCIERSDLLVEKGKKRMDRLFQKISKKCNKYGQNTESTRGVNMISLNIDCSNLHKNQQALELCRDSIMTGLHTCGDLGPLLIDVFLNSSAQGLVSIGCCYHLIQESRSFPMSDHVTKCLQGNRLFEPLEGGIMAGHAVEIWRSKPQTYRLDHLHRNQLEVALVIASTTSHDGSDANELDPCHIKVSQLRLHRDMRRNRIYKDENQARFIDYAYHVIARLDNGTYVPREILEHVDEMYADKGFDLLVAFVYVTRLKLGSVYESLLLLDRAIHCEEVAQQKNINLELYLLPIFDPLQSPRNTAIIALKH